MAREELSDMLQTDAAYDLAIGCHYPLVTTVCSCSCWLRTPKVPARGRKCCLKRRPSPQIWWHCGTSKESSNTLPSSMVTTPTRMAQGMDIACHLRTSWQDLLCTFTALWLLSRGMVYLYWPVQCMPANAVYTGRYDAYWPVHCVLVSILVHWRIHCILASILYTGQYTVYWPVLLYTGQYTVYWPVQCILASAIGKCSLHWPVECALVSNLVN